MDVSMVIAAWGEGVGLLVSPSPSLDRLSSAKTCVKIAGWVLGHAPSAAGSRPPTPMPKMYNMTETLMRTFSFFYTRMRQCSPIGYNWPNIDNWNNTNLGFHEDYVLRICNVQ
jgi:hypothetical protein